MQKESFLLSETLSRKRKICSLRCRNSGSNHSISNVSSFNWEPLLEGKVEIRVLLPQSETVGSELKIILTPVAFVSWVFVDFLPLSSIHSFPSERPPSQEVSPSHSFTTLCSLPLSSFSVSSSSKSPLFSLPFHFLNLNRTWRAVDHPIVQLIYALKDRREIGVLGALRMVRRSSVKLE